ncbi:MAG: alcohol dehydrogenase catalytic domain-containing protein [Desulfobacteraceae bacterium]|nr:alcohol dehydrogenase catalytic domain-containing protein [Desulfobacteraceae bacterium]
MTRKGNRAASMRALVLDGGLRLAADYPRPRPAPGEALVRVLLAGICGTDLELARGYLRFRGVPGHEFVGVVEEVNGPEAGLVGRRVVGEINLGCGKCGFCRRGLGNHCPDRRVLGILSKDGAFADYLALPVANLHPVPEGVADEEAVFTEPLAAAFEVPEQLHLRPSAEVLVMGDGRLGLLLAQVLRLGGAAVTLLGRHPEKLAIAGGRGIATLLSGELSAGAAFETVVEATGSAAGLRQALTLVRPRGTLVLKSTVAGPPVLDPTPLVLNEITLLGSRCGPFGPALRALAARQVAVRPLIAGTYPLARAVEAFAAAPGALKVLLDLRE